MACSPTGFSDGGGLDVQQAGRTARKKRRTAIRRVEASEAATVKLKLVIERAKYISEHPTLGILGVQLVCPV